MIRKFLEKLASDESDKIVLLDPSALGSAKPEPDLRIIGMFCDVHEEKVAEIIHAMLYLNEMNKLEKKAEDKRPIEFYLSTYGGSADDMFALYDIMRTIRQTSEIHTLGLGKVMSAGVPILAAGTKGKRKIGKNCRIMIHNVSAGTIGSVETMENEIEEIKWTQDSYIECLSKYTKLTKAKIKKLLKTQKNVYISAEEAIKMGIVDEII